MYVGYWKAGMAHGKGWFFHGDGDINKGDWVEGKMNGQGTYLHVHGQKYVGHFYDDTKSGYAEESWPDG